MSRDPGRPFVAIDLGATSGRVLMNDPRSEGGIGAWRIAHRFRNPPVASSSTSTWDVSALFEQTILGLRSAMQLADSWNLRVGGIGVCSWGVDYAILADGKLRVPPRRYQRMTEQDLRECLKVVDADALYATTGVLPQKINTRGLSISLPRVAWLIRGSAWRARAGLRVVGRGCRGGSVAPSRRAV